jgi:hypothetical protein
MATSPSAQPPPLVNQAWTTDAAQNAATMTIVRALRAAPSTSG